MSHPSHRLCCSAVLAALLASGPAGAATQLFFATMDGKAQVQDGKLVSAPGQDTLAIVQLDANGLHLLQQLPVPNSVVGPAQSVAVTPDGQLALVTAGKVRDPAGSGKVAPGDLLTVIDLSVTPARVLATLHAGVGAAGMSISPDGKLALVAAIGDGSITAFRIDGKRVQPAGRLELGAGAQPAMVSFTPDGRQALVTRNGDHKITVLNVAGGAVSLAGRDVYAGLRPDALDITSDGAYAVAGNVGESKGDADSVSLVDLRSAPARTVDTASVGQTPEDVAFSPDGRFVGVTVMNGSNKAPTSPFYHPHGRFQLLRRDHDTLTRVSDVEIGAWPQGLAFSADGRHVVVENATDKTLQVLAIDGDRVSDTGQRLRFDAAPAGLRAVVRP